MKNILSALFAIFSLLMVSTASNAGMSIGVSGVAGAYQAKGTEKESTETTKTTEEIMVGYASIFVEYQVNDQISIGIDYIPYTIETEESIRTDVNLGTSGVNDSGDNKAKASFNNHLTLYGVFGGEQGPYVRAGAHWVEVESQESLVTGSEYGNEEILGGYLGLGYQTQVNADAFIRVELGYSVYEEISLKSSTNSDNTVSADLEGATARISIGKSF